MHSAGLELTKLTYTRLEDNLIRHRGDRLFTMCQVHTRHIHVSTPGVFCACRRCLILRSIYY